MAGLGRRSHYRKHLTDSVLNDFPEPGENELIAKVVATRGSNQFDICTPSASSTSSQLAILPTKFNKLVWVKRNDFVIVQHGSSENENGTDESKGGIRFIIQNILYKEQIKHLKSKNLWPKEFTDDVDEDKSDNEETEEIEANEKSLNEKNKVDDGIVYDQGYDFDDEMLMMNTNRINALTIDNSSDSSDDEE